MRRRKQAEFVPDVPTAKNYRFRSRTCVRSRHRLGTGAATRHIMEMEKRIRHQPTVALRSGSPEDIFLNLDSDDHVLRTMIGLMLVRKDPEAMERVVALLRPEQRSRVGYRLGGSRVWIGGRP